MALTTSQVIDGVFADAATGDLERVLSWWSDEGTLEDVSIAQAFVGKPAIRDYLRWYFAAMPSVRYEPIRLLVSGPTAMVEWMQTTEVVAEFDGVAPPPGTVLQLHAIDVFHVVDGLIEHEVSWYGDGWLRQRLDGTAPAGTPAPLPLTPALNASGMRFPQ
jgi:predicted ester cyclase